MKMKAVYLNDRGAAQIRQVYNPETRAALAGLLDINEDVYAAQDLGNPALYDAEAVFSTWHMPALKEDEIARFLPNLKILFYAAGSVQQFARPFLARSVRVVSAWAANAIPVAEFTLAQILLANKGYFLSPVLFASQGFERAHNYSVQSFPGTFDCTVGIVGAGMIGGKVIELLRACNARVRILVFDPFLPDEKAKALGAAKCSLEALFTESQTITNHLANNAQTQGMLNYALFRLMKPNATFINTGRGAQVVEPDLVRALRECPDRTALLDVTDPEPPEAGHPFYTMSNVFLTGHIAGSMGSETYRMGEYMLEELKLYLNGAPLRYEVTERMLATMA